MASKYADFRKIYLKRLFLVIVWYVCCVTAIFLLLTLINNFIFSWKLIISNALFQMLLCLIGFGFFGVLCTATESKRRIKPLSNISSRYNYLVSRFTIQSMLFFIVYILNGAFVALALKWTNEYFSLKEDCIKNICTSEKHYFLFASGVFANVVLYCQDFISESSYSFFPPVNQRRLLTLFTPFLLLQKSMKASLNIFFAFIPVYFTISWSYYCLNLLNFVPISINFISIIQLFDVGLLYHLWFICTFALFGNSILKQLFELHIFNLVKFPITGTDKCTLIKVAISATDVPLLQYLGYSDLLIISERDKRRRGEIFSSNVSGGYAQTWKIILKEITDFICQNMVELQHISNHINRGYNTSVNYDRLFKEPSRTASSFTVNSPYTSKLQHEETMADKCILNLKGLKIVTWFTNEMPEKRLEEIMKNYGQSLALACQSVANLTSSTLAEDKYGMVQDDMSAIIHLLLQFRSTLNNLDVSLNKRKIGSSTLLLKKSLKYAIKSSLYKMALTFGRYIKDLSLTPEDQKNFSNFVNFKEM